MEDEGSSRALKRPCEDLVQAASDMTAAASGRKAIKPPNYEDRFEDLTLKSVTYPSPFGPDGRLNVPSRCICKFPPGWSRKDHTVPKRYRRVPRPKVCGEPAKPFMPPKVRGDDFFRELNMKDPSYKAAVAAGYKVEIKGRAWKAELPPSRNPEGGIGIHWEGDRLVIKIVGGAARTRVRGGLASDTTTASASASGRKDLKHPFEDPNSTAVIAASSISGGKAVKRPLVNSASEMEDEGGKDVKHPCEDPNSSSATAAAASSAVEIREKFMGDNPNPACEQQTTPPY